MTDDDDFLERFQKMTEKEKLASINAMSDQMDARTKEDLQKDRKRLVEGPDPNRKWQDPIRLWQEGGLWCAILRHLGHLNGYVRIPEDHPWWGLTYRDEVPNPVGPDLYQHPEEFMEGVGVMPAFAAIYLGGYEEMKNTLGFQVQVHGGVTFAGTLAIDGAPWGWWIGFDTGHAGDAMDPAHVDERMRAWAEGDIARGDHLWTEDEVAAEVSRMVVCVRLAQPQPKEN